MSKASKRSKCALQCAYTLCNGLVFVGMAAATAYIVRELRSLCDELQHLEDLQTDLTAQQAKVQNSLSDLSNRLTDLHASLPQSDAGGGSEKASEEKTTGTSKSIKAGSRKSTSRKKDAGTAADGGASS